jgi:type I restriction enzyme R subunit
MTSNYKEQDFEEHIEHYLLDSGYDKASPSDYDKEFCLLPEKVMAFLENTQPEKLDSLRLQYGDNLANKICMHLSRNINLHGTLHVLRKGLDDRGVNLKFAWFKPSSGLNPKHLELYEKNQFTVVRQVRYSKKNENSIDIVLFLNGIPIITMELKNSLTGQFVENAIKQYRKDRDSREPMLQFRRCLVHFAVGNEKVFMTTRLQNGKTRFLPFNKDTENPVNPSGHKTAYLWEDVLQPDTLLSLIANYLHLQKDIIKVYKKGHGVVEHEKEVFIFPRYHQFDAVRTIISAVKKQGVGCSYLVQHSAGSGKSNSIAWLAHQLASLYQNQDDRERLFDSVVVITDRKVLDSQL